MNTTEAEAMADFGSEWLRLFQGATRAGVLLVGGLYGVGLLIVNVDLGRYGLLNLEFARVEYVIAGVLWAFLMTSSLAAIEVVVERAKQKFSSQKKPRAVLGVLFEAALGLNILSLVFSNLSHGEISLLKLRAWVWVLVIFANALFVDLTLTSIKRMVKNEPLSVKSLLAGPTWAATPIYTVALALSFLVLYSTSVFPKFPREFGGGKKPVVRIFWEAKPQTPLGELGLPLSKDGQSVGPVLLVLETSNMFMVKPMEEDEEWFPARQTASVVGLEKKLVSVIVYNPSKK